MPTPLSDVERLALLHRLSVQADELADLVWSVADSFALTGSSADDLAHALGLTRRTFYARLATWRAARDRRR